MARTSLAIEREVDDTRSIWDMSASVKRKENQSFSSSKKKQKTYASHGSQGQGRGHQDQGQGQSFRGGRHFRAPRQSRQRACFHCHQLGHFRRDCPQRQGSQSYGTPQSQSSVGHAQKPVAPPYPSMGQGSWYQSHGAAQAPTIS